MAGCLRATSNLAWRRQHARRRRRGCLAEPGWAVRDMLSSLEHLSQLESLAHARLCGMEIGGAGLGAGLCASNLAALSAALSAT